jgi:hypothetical protein
MTEYELWIRALEKSDLAFGLSYAKLTPRRIHMSFFLA